MATKIVRLTRHVMTAEQADELERIYPGAVIEQLDVTLPTDPVLAVSRFDEIVATAAADVVEAVLPLPITQAVLNHSRFAKEGGELIKSVMLSDRQGGFALSHYEKVLEVKIVSERL